MHVQLLVNLETFLDTQEILLRLITLLLQLIILVIHQEKVLCMRLRSLVRQLDQLLAI